MQRIVDCEWVDRTKSIPSAALPTGKRLWAIEEFPLDTAEPITRRPRAQSRLAKNERAKADRPSHSFLLRELANGEVAAALFEERAKASGLSLRTLDRARAGVAISGVNAIDCRKVRNSIVIFALARI